MFEFNNKLSIDFMSYFQDLPNHLWEIIALVLDIIIVGYLCIKFFKFSKKTKVWQLVKGILFLVLITFLSGVLKFRILNFILTSVMTYGVIALMIVFQPELRRALETLGSGSIFKIFGFDRDIADKAKEDIYKTAIAVQELSNSKTGALIVFEREVKLQDIIDTGIVMDSDVSPQLLCNIFVPNTPLHDGAVVISNNKIAASACILPLADDKDIARNLGTRHRAAIGMSKESDAVVIVVSEETGKVSIAKDGTLIADVKDDVLKRILMKHLVINRYGTEEQNERVNKFKERMAERKLKAVNKKKERAEKLNQEKDEKYKIDN